MRESYQSSEYTDKDGYPTKKALEKIKSWNSHDVDGFLDFLKSIWWWEYGYILKGKNIRRLYLHTGGWSGNEDVIEVLLSSWFGWCYWEESRRGGHYKFVIRKIK